MMNAEQETEVLARRERIEKLRARAEALCKGEFTSFTSDHCPLEVQEEFWKRVVAFEESGLTTMAELLKQRGVDLTPAAQLDDEQLTKRLWALIGHLAEMRCFFTHTDHLSDREFYTHLLERTLQDEVEAAMAVPDPNAAYHYDLIGGGSDDDIRIMLRYYSDEAEREQWHSDFPDDEVPPMRTPPYDRDRLLPKWND